MCSVDHCIIPLTPILLQLSGSGVFRMISLECPPGYVLAEAPLETGYETCSCNSNNDLILQCKGRNILIEVIS